MSITAVDMVDKWNHDMNTFIALLFDMCRRTYEDRINNVNSLKSRFMSQSKMVNKMNKVNSQMKYKVAKDDF